MKKISKQTMIGAGVVLSAAVAFGLFLLVLAPNQELRTILSSDKYPDRAPAYRALIERVGVEEAQEMLAASGLPVTGEAHLLQHLAGRAAYEKYGLEGITYCAPYFLYACYHEFMIRATDAEGTEVIRDILPFCYAKGSLAAAQCAHGIGHGLLALVGYKDLPGALRECEALKAGDPLFRLYNCLDGVFMENIWAVHEGEPSPDRWANPDDLQYPCDDPQIAGNPDWGPMCWGNQPVLAYQLSQGSLETLASFCLSAPDKYKNECFGGVARQLQPIANNNVEKARSLCNMVAEAAGADEGYRCVNTLASSSEGLGASDFAYRLCASLPGIKAAECTGVVDRGAALK